MSCDRLGLMLGTLEHMGAVISQVPLLRAMGGPRRCPIGAVEVKGVRQRRGPAEGGALCFRAMHRSFLTVSIALQPLSEVRRMCWASPLLLTPSAPDDPTNRWSRFGPTDKTSARWCRPGNPQCCRPEGQHGYYSRCKPTGKSNP